MSAPSTMRILAAVFALLLFCAEIRWPSGQWDKLTHIEANQIVKLREGEGVVASKRDKVSRDSEVGVKFCDSH